MTKRKGEHEKSGQVGRLHNTRPHLITLCTSFSMWRPLTTNVIGIHKIVTMSFLCYDTSGNKLDNFTAKFNPGDVQISSYLTVNIRGESCMTAIWSPMYSRSVTEFQLLTQEFRTQTYTMSLDLSS